MSIYRLTSGKFRRFEGGQLTEYVAGDLVDLNTHEARRLSSRTQPIGRVPGKAPKPCPEPTPKGRVLSGPSPQSYPDPSEAFEDKPLSGPVTTNLPDATQDTDPVDFASKGHGSGAPTPQSVAPTSFPGGHPVFTASDTPRRTFTELKQVVANIGEPSMLGDMIEVEQAMANRSTVLTLLESRLHKLELEKEERERITAPAPVEVEAEAEVEAKPRGEAEADAEDDAEVGAESEAEEDTPLKED